MARPTFTQVQDAVTTLFNALSDNLALPGARNGVQQLDEVKRVLDELYKPTAYWGGKGTYPNALVLFAAKGDWYQDLNPNKRRTWVKRDWADGDLLYFLPGSADTSNTFFASAKGSAPTGGDVFELVSVAGSTIAYLGNTRLNFGATDDHDL